MQRERERVITAREAVSDADEERSVRQVGWACYVVMALPLVLAAR